MGNRNQYSLFTMDRVGNIVPKSPDPYLGQKSRINDIKRQSLEYHRKQEKERLASGKMRRADWIFKVWQKYFTLTDREAQHFLEIDFGVRLKDNAFGQGRLDVAVNFPGWLIMPWETRECKITGIKKMAWALIKVEKIPETYVQTCYRLFKDREKAEKYIRYIGAIRNGSARSVTNN